MYSVERRTAGGWSRLGVYRTLRAAEVHAYVLALCHAHGAPAVRVREIPTQEVKWGWTEQEAVEEVQQ